MDAKPLLRRRRERRSLNKHNAQGRLTRTIIAVGASLIGLFSVLMVIGALVYAKVTADLPSPDLLPSLLDPASGSLLQPTRLYDRSGEHVLMVLAPWDSPRSYIPYNPKLPGHLPDTLVRATIALADPGFWTHPGYRLDNLANPSFQPTLAQTLVSNLLLWNEPPGWRRTLRVQILSAQITSRFGREKIIEWYLNSANYGHYAYGAEAASELYLGKPLAQINLAEAALLASVSQTPAINPLDAPEAALQREQDALNLIQSRGMASAAEVILARETSIVFVPAPRQANLAPSFSAMALSQLDNRFDRNRIEQGGLQVLTTLDYDLQLRATCAVQTQLNRLNNPGQGTAQTCDGAGSLPPLPPLNGNDVPQSASAAVLDPDNGQLLALIGDAQVSGDPGYVTPHQPGTLLTPFIYLAGFTRGLSPASLIWDLPPKNSPSAPTDRTYQGPVQLRTAIENDNLVVAAQVFNQMGSNLVQQTIKPFGLNIPAVDLQSLIETENRYSVVQMAQSYGIFATLGSLAGQDSPEGLVPAAILSVRTLDGTILADWNRTSSAQVVSPQLAYLLTDVLSADFSDLAFPAALKTGTTSAAAETWAVGYTPHRVVAVWMGKGVVNTSAISTPLAAGLWESIMTSASLDVPPDDWAQPAGMLRIKVCEPSGMLPTDSCPNVVNEFFIEGYQPMQADTLYHTYAINRETGLLATVFTPQQLVEKHVYMLVPPEAQAWAQIANLPVPPTQYDNIQPPAPNPHANIRSPAMFADLPGQVTITGTADGVNFSYYRLQYGQGLNPDTWIQIGADVKNPVTNGKLVEWDATGLKGLYSLQLLVVHTDRSLDTATVQVSLGNQ